MSARLSIRGVSHACLLVSVILAELGATLLMDRPALLQPSVPCFPPMAPSRAETTIQVPVVNRSGRPIRIVGIPRPGGQPGLFRGSGTSVTIPPWGRVWVPISGAMIRSGRGLARLVALTDDPDLPRFELLVDTGRIPFTPPSPTGPSGPTTP